MAAGLEPDLTDVDVGIARTLPPRGELPAVREVEKLYLDMIAAARRTIYIENQYFTAPRIAAALEKRLAEPDGPEVVLVLRLLSHGWLEEATMHVLRTRLIRRLRQVDRFGRFRVYYPHMPGLAEGACIDVHSKLMIVDDDVRAHRLGQPRAAARWRSTPSATWWSSRAARRGSPRRSAASASACSPSTSTPSPRACARRSRRPAA